MRRSRRRSWEIPAKHSRTGSPANPSSQHRSRPLQALIDTYDNCRPHRSLPHQATPAATYRTRPKAGPTADRSHNTHYRVLNDKIDHDGKPSLRVSGKMHHIGTGTEPTRTQVLKLVDGLHVRVINAATTATVTHRTTGEILSEHDIDTAQTYWRNKNKEPGRWPGSQR